MTWRDDLLPGSFRGVAFNFQQGDGEYGRQIVTHEYPGRDIPYPEDLRRKTRAFSFDAIIIGDDYNQRRDALIAAVEQAGAAELVHPRFGTLSVVATVLRVRESTRSGGMCSITLECIEAGAAEYPNAVVDTQTEVINAATVAQSASNTEFEEAFSVLGAPGWVADEAITRVSAAVDDIRRLNGSVNAALQPLSTLAQQFDDLGAELGDLIRTPLTLATQLSGVISGIVGVGTDVRVALAAYDELSAFGSSVSDVPSSTPSRTQQANNQTAVHTLVRQSAAIAAANTTSQFVFESYNEAAAVRSNQVEKLDNEAASATYPVFVGLTDLRAAVVNDITTRGADLSRIVYHTPKATLPATLLAYQLNGDFRRDAELIARNATRHPLFVAGGHSLEVLSDG